MKDIPSYIPNCSEFRGLLNGVKYTGCFILKSAILGYQPVSKSLLD